MLRNPPECKARKHCTALKKMKNILTITILTCLLCSCVETNKRVGENKDPILLADREAPLGWVYLRIFNDSTFEFESRGLRTGIIYPGKVKITSDTLYFEYLDSIPKAGSKAIYSDKYVVYTNGEYPERVQIKLSELDYNSLKIDSQKYFEIQKSMTNKDSLLNIKPIDFLKSLTYRKLKKGTETNKIINTIPFNIFIHKEWVTKEDVRQLMKYLYKQDIAETPWPMISSQMPKENSTAGIEAMHLINIYKDTTFHYPSLCSTYYLCKPDEQVEKAKEFEIWWKEQLKE